MVIDAVVLIAVGIVAMLLPAFSGYRSSLVRRIARQGHAHVPAEQVPALETRATRRARSVGVGILVAGLVVLVLALLWSEREETPSRLSLILSLMLVFGAGALAFAEIFRPGDVTDGPRWARSTR